jgi:hypothetical protein
MPSQPSGEIGELGWVARVAQRFTALRLRDVRNLTRVGI